MIIKSSLNVVTDLRLMDAQHSGDLRLCPLPLAVQVLSDPGTVILAERPDAQT